MLMRRGPAPLSLAQRATGIGETLIKAFPVRAKDCPGGGGSNARTAFDPHLLRLRGIQLGGAILWWRSAVTAARDGLPLALSIAPPDAISPVISCQSWPRSIRRQVHCRGRSWPGPQSRGLRAISPSARPALPVGMRLLTVTRIRLDPAPPPRDRGLPGTCTVSERGNEGARSGALTVSSAPILQPEPCHPCQLADVGAAQRRIERTGMAGDQSQVRGLRVRISLSPSRRMITSSASSSKSRGRQTA